MGRNFIAGSQKGKPMDIKLSESEVTEFLEDKWVNITIGDYRVYVELDSDDCLWYVELVKSKSGKTEQGYTFDVTDLDKLEPQRPNDPSWYHNDPLCPKCGTYMIYKFEFCPRCGQKLDWSEK